MSNPISPPLSYAAYQDRHYIPELDGVRALCALIVVSVHLYDSGAVWWWLAGHQGVTVFFVLSGYLITMLALREEARRGRVSLAAFYVRRSFRLFPLYYTVLGIYGVAILVLDLAPHLRPLLRAALPCYLTYFQEVAFFRWVVVAQQDLPFFHTWSLGIEEKFYLVWPLLAFVLCRGAHARRRAGALALTVTFALLPTALHLVDPGLKVIGRCLFSYYHILVGCALALLLEDPRWFARLRWLGTRSATAAALALFLALHFLGPWAPPLPIPHGLDILYSLSVALLLTAVLLGRGRLQQVLRLPPLVFIGKLSYGIYLVHVLAVSAAHKIAPPGRGLALSVLAYLLACGLSIGVAWVLAVLVERRGLELGRRRSRRLLEGGRLPVEGRGAILSPGTGLSLAVERVHHEIRHRHSRRLRRRAPGVAERPDAPAGGAHAEHGPRCP